MITIKCQVSLSKKLRALIGNNKTILTLITESLQDGKANANIIFDLEDVTQKSVDDLMNTETSIMLTPTDITDGIPKDAEIITNIFASETSDEDLSKEPEESPINSLASFSAPEKKKDVAYAIKSKNTIAKQVPKAFVETKNPNFVKYVTTLDQLLTAIRLAENKTSDIDVESIQDPRKRAVAMEAKEKAEAIDYPAFVVNEKCANLTLNDLGINLLLNVPYNLENVSAKRLAESKDLKNMFRMGMLKFIAPEEIKSYLRKAESAVGKPELEILNGRARDAAENMDSVERSNEVQVDLDEINEPTEQERLASLTSMPIREDKMSDNGVRRSTHGDNMPRRNRFATQERQERQDDGGAKKTIRRSGIEFN